MSEIANSKYSEELKHAVELARGAGKIVLEHYGKVARLTKRQEEAVTDADRASQRFIVAGLQGKFSSDGIIGEENDDGSAITFDVADPMGRNWVIDPIDGTNNFVSGLGGFAVCIGLLDAGMPVVGVVLDVTREWMYWAAMGSGAWLDGRKISVLKNPMDSATLLMMTSNVLDGQGRLPAYAVRWISQTHWKIRMLGSAAIEAVQVAAGVAHGAVTMNGKLWDAVAPAAIVMEAGGVVTDHAGKAVFPFDLRGYTGAKVPFLAAAPVAQKELLAEMRR